MMRRAFALPAEPQNIRTLCDEAHFRAILSNPIGIIGVDLTGNTLKISFMPDSPEDDGIVALHFPTPMDGTRALFRLNSVLKAPPFEDHHAQVRAPHLGLPSKRCG